MTKKNNANQLKGGIVLTYVTLGLGLLISLIYTPIMIRLLGQSEYGLYNLAASVISYLGILNFGFGSAYIRYYSRYKNSNDQDGIAKLNGMFLIVFLIISLLTIISGLILTIYAGIVFGNEITPQQIQTARVLMVILTINLAISFPSIVFVSYIRANERFIFQNIISLVKMVTSPFLIIPILLLGYGSIGMALVSTVLNIFANIVYILYARRRLSIRISFKTFDMSLFKEMALFSSFIFLNIVTDQINWNVDKFLIGRFHGTIPVAIYSIAALFNTQYLSLSTAISSVFVPRVHRIIYEKNTDQLLTALFIKVGRIQFIIMALILSGFIFFGKPFIFWWAGENYGMAYYIIIILTGAVTIPIIQNIGIEIQRAKNLHKFRSLTYLIIALLNIGISIPLVIVYEGIGAAIGTALALLIGNGIIMNVYYHKRVGLNIIKFWKEIFEFLPSFVFPILFVLVYTHFVDIYTISYFLLGIISYTIIYILSVWLFGLNQFEKELISKPLRKVLNKFMK